MNFIFTTTNFQMNAALLRAFAKTKKKQKHQVVPKKPILTAGFLRTFIWSRKVATLFSQKG